MRENWKQVCEARLAMLNAHAEGGRFTLWSESGVKRVYRQAEGQSGMSQFGGGHLSYRELATFLDGVRETLWGISYGTISVPASVPA